MTIVSHEREPGELGYVARYARRCKELEATGARTTRRAFGSDQREAVAWAYVEAEMLRLHVCRRLSERLDGVDHGPERLDRQAADDLGRADRRARRARVRPAREPRSTPTTSRSKVYLYSRAQSVMGGTSQIQKNIIATRILGLPAAERTVDRHRRKTPMKYDLPDVDPRRGRRAGPDRAPVASRAAQRDQRRAAPRADAELFPQLSADADARVAVHHRRRARLLGRRRLRPPRPDGQGPGAAPRTRSPKAASSCST